MKPYIVFLLLIALQVASCSKSGNDAPAPPSPPPPPPPSSTNLVELDANVQIFMSQYNIPGLSLAITRNGKLIYTKGYGFADKDASTPVTDSSLFRLASVSKCITAITIMQLVEQGKLTLNDKVFGAGALLGTQYGNQPYGQHITNITVRHLLQHAAGGWGNTNSDPMFSNANLNGQELLSWILDNRPLVNTPGTNYEYSNVGFFILGLIVEKITGKPYETYVREAILQPAGITAMRIAGNLKADKRPNEVTYYGQSGQNPYINTINRLGACGGWIASPTDLMRLLVRVDGFTTKPDMLAPETIQAMVTPSFANNNYACGWHVNNSNNWWHTGSLPGTSTIMVRADRGFNWAVLTNTRNTNDNYYTDLDRLVWKSINNSNTPWPEVDLF